MTDESGHIPVLTGEVLALLDPKPGVVVVDCTVGRGGHAALIAEKLQPGGRYIGFDLDQANLDFARQRLSAAHATIDLVHGSFADARQHLRDLGIDRVDGLLADLGFGLDLSTCAVTGSGSAADLVYVSPRTGRAVSRQGAGEYADRLLQLPGFLTRDEPAKVNDVLAGLRLTGAFLERHLFAALDRPVPEARRALVDRLSRRSVPLDEG